MGTIWRDLSTPPQRRQGPDPRPFRLLVGTLLVIGPELTSWRAEHSLLWRMSLYIFDIVFYHLTCSCHTFYALSALAGCWSSVFIRRIIYKFLNICSFDYIALWLVGRLGSRQPFNHTSLVAFVIPSDRPKSVCNRCVIEVLVAFLCCRIAFWIFAVGVRLSQIFSLFSHYQHYTHHCHVIFLKWKVFLLLNCVLTEGQNVPLYFKKYYPYKSSNDFSSLYSTLKHDLLKQNGYL